MSNGTRQEFSFEGDESYIMEQLTLVVRGQDPDVITGYNIDNFDLPKLNDRTDIQSRKSIGENGAALSVGEELNNLRLSTSVLEQANSSKTE